MRKPIHHGDTAGTAKHLTTAIGLRHVRRVAVVCGCSVSLAFAAQVDTRRAELKQLQGRIGALQADVAKSEATKADIAATLRRIESSITVANRTLRDLRDARAIVAAQLVELERQSRQLSGQIERRQKQLSELLYRQFVQGHPDALRLAIAGQDPNASARERYFVALVSRENANLLDSTRDALREKTRLAEAAHDKGEELASIERRQQAERANLLVQQKQRKALLAQLSTRITSQKKQIGTLKADEKRLGNLIDRLARRAARPKPKYPGAAIPKGEQRGPDLSNVSGPFAALRGKLRLPVRGEIVGRFGMRRGDGAAIWKGLFLRAAEGSDVRAVADGTVAYADTLRGFGNLMIIDHSDGFLSVYGNNHSLLRSAGAQIKAGEPIATVGSGDGAEESGLYFELRHRGQPFDPLRWISPK